MIGVELFEYLEIASQKADCVNSSVPLWNVNFTRMSRTEIWNYFDGLCLSKGVRADLKKQGIDNPSIIDAADFLAWNYAFHATDTVILRCSMRLWRSREKQIKRMARGFEREQERQRRILEILNPDGLDYGTRLVPAIFAVQNSIALLAAFEAAFKVQEARANE